MFSCRLHAVKFSSLKSFCCVRLPLGPVKHGAAARNKRREARTRAARDDSRRPGPKPHTTTVEGQDPSLSDDKRPGPKPHMTTAGGQEPSLSHDKRPGPKPHATTRGQDPSLTRPQQEAITQASHDDCRRPGGPKPRLATASLTQKTGIGPPLGPVKHLLPQPGSSRACVCVNAWTWR